MTILNMRAAVPLATYNDRRGEEREVAAVAGARASRLVVDRRVSDHGDERLVAHLSADEPCHNARIVCDAYLRSSDRGCRRLREDDLTSAPFGYIDGNAGADPVTQAAELPAGRDGSRYFLGAVGCPSQLRWICVRAGSSRPLTVREVVGALELYDPVVAVTRAEIERHRYATMPSIATLALELRRLERSPIVLNRRLREAVVDAVRRGEASFSAIAMACGRVKRDSRGRYSGETSWLGRRVGLMANTGSARPNPWVHSDVLGLIAREGLGVAPREVELG